MAASSHFIHWIMALGEGAKIIGPENMVEEVRKKSRGLQTSTEKKIERKQAKTDKDSMYKGRFMDL